MTFNFTHEEYSELLNMMIDSETELGEQRETIKSLTDSLTFTRETLSTDYVPRAKYDADLQVTREQIEALAAYIGEINGFPPSQVMNGNLVGNRMNKIEQDYRRIETILSDATELMGEVILEAKNGRNPFMPKKPSSIDRLEAKKQVITNLRNQKT